MYQLILYFKNGHEFMHQLYSRGWMYKDELTQEVGVLLSERDDWTGFDVVYLGEAQ